MAISKPILNIFSIGKKAPGPRHLKIFRALTFGQKSLLEKHVNFVPLPERVNKTQTLYDIKRFSRAMRWKEVWGSSEDSTPRQKMFAQKNIICFKFPHRNL